SDLAGNLGQENNPEWKTIALDSLSKEFVSPLGSIGYRWNEKGKWNIEAREGTLGKDVELQLSLIDEGNPVEVAFPYFGGDLHDYFQHVDGEGVQFRRVPSRELTLADGSKARVATVFDISAAGLAIDRG